MIGTQRVVCPRPQSSGAIKIRLAERGIKEGYFYKITFLSKKDMLKKAFRFVFRRLKEQKRSLVSTIHRVKQGYFHSVSIWETGVHSTGFSRAFALGKEPD